jgi:hypothetical protein
VASFDELAQISSATVGMVITPVGHGSSPTLRLGDWCYIGPAWSTIKVPLAIAAIRRPTSDLSLVDAAITESDSAAAERLWTDLGEPETASSHVEEVLATAGDLAKVQSRRVRPGFSAFGQTQWPLADQAMFMSIAVCDPRNDTVVTSVDALRVNVSYTVLVGIVLTSVLIRFAVRFNPFSAATGGRVAVGMAHLLMRSSHQNRSNGQNA